MGSSFVHIGEHGFWMRDGILELWLRLLALHIKDPRRGEASVSREIRDNWLLASRGYFVGCVPTDLDEAVATAEGKRIVLDAIDSLMTALQKGPPMLDRDTLNILGTEGGTWASGDFEVSRLIEVGNAFRALIAGEIKTGASSTEFWPGSTPSKDCS